MTSFFWVFVCALCLTGGNALVFDGKASPGNLDIDLCDSDDLYLYWFVSKTAEETIVDTQWFYEGRSQQLIAIRTHGQLSIMPSFSGRVEPWQNAGLIIRNMTEAESGNYSVEVNAVNASGGLVTLRGSAFVQIKDGLRTSDGELHASLSPVAMFDDVSRQWHVILTCGHFLYRHSPRFDLRWTTPRGEIKSSTRYEDGQFVLRLDNPVVGGSYTCQIQEASHACIRDNKTRREASVSVNGLEARLTLVEARQESLATLNNQQLTLVQSRVDQITEGITKERVSFHARGLNNAYPPSGSALILLTVINNQGRAYDSTTGIFTAPYNGTYCFMGHAGAYDNVNSESMALMVNGQQVDYARMMFSQDIQSGSVQAVVRLSVGDRVWLKSDGAHNHFWGTSTAFSGFLLYLDP